MLEEENIIVNEKFNIKIIHGLIFQVDPKLLAAGIVKLKEITLTYTCLTLY